MQRQKEKKYQEIEYEVESGKRETTVKKDSDEKEKQREI